MDAVMTEIMRSPSSSSASSKWACLHRDVVDSILDRLFVLSDLVRFSAVCKSWNCMALNQYKEKRIPQINHHLPWLVVQRKGQERDYSLYDVTSSRICNFQFRIPLLRRKSNCGLFDYDGTSHGWLFVWDKTALKMLNPISGTMFGLPPFIYGEGVCRPKRVALSRDPSNCLRSPFEVLACSSVFNVMAHWKSGDKFWSYSERSKEHKDRFRFHDFIFYKDHMLGIGCSNMNELSVTDVISINIDNTQTLHSHSSGKIKIERIASTPRLEFGKCVEGYLVETTKGDLLMVQRNIEFGTSSFPFKVNKLIIGSNHDSAKIIPITNLDGESLFLGENNHSISVLASNFPGCIPNSIYNSKRPGLVEVFNLEDGCVSKCFSTTASMDSVVTPWIVPSMKLL